MRILITLQGEFTPADEKRQVTLPFHMPPSASRLDITYSYSNRIGSSTLLEGGNTLDLGLFDERGVDFLTAGFRGWSGSERTSISVTEDLATPGYLSGPLKPGFWHVLLGLYKIAPEGCSYQVDIGITTEAEERPNSELLGAAYSLPASPPLAPFGPWLRGDLHCHTWHSDGDSSPAQVVALSRQRGLDFLAISDHNTIAAHRDLAMIQDPGLILIPAVEVTTMHGHFNAWGTGMWIDFRAHTADEMAAAINFARGAGALTSCSHPKPFGPPWDFGEVTDCDCIEVWNGPWFLLNQIALDAWEKQLAGGRRIPAVAGSDYHRAKEMEDDEPRAPGMPCTWVYVPGEPSVFTIIDAVRSGHVSLSKDVNGPLLEIYAGLGFAAMGGDGMDRPSQGSLPLRLRCRGGAGDRLVLLDQHGALWEQSLEQDDETVTVDLAVSACSYVRAELRDADEAVTALTNPVYLM